MKITTHEHYRSGAFGDVYRGTDEIGRKVAVKVIRETGRGAEAVVAHARALARAAHENVVVVYSVEEIPDPEGQGIVSAIIMEFLEGETLEDRLKRALFTINDSERIGQQLCAGLSHIHAQGLNHGDLHSGNVILGQSGPKIIDILYLDSLALLSTQSRESRMRRDVMQLRMLLGDIIEHTENAFGLHQEFVQLTKDMHAVEAVAAVFLESLRSATEEPSGREAEGILQRIRDPHFVAGRPYAEAVAGKLTADSALQVLSLLLEEHVTTEKHVALAAVLFERLDEKTRAQIVGRLSECIDKEVPAGQYADCLHLLQAFGPTGWIALPDLTRLRLEGLILEDVLTGRYDVYGTPKTTGGALGLWAKTFGHAFTDRDRLVENLAAMLTRDWYTQNYVAEHLLELIPLIGTRADHKEKLVNAIATAVKNDAKRVKVRLPHFPADWVASVDALTAPETPPNWDDTPF